MAHTSDIAPELFLADYLERLRIPVRGLFHITGQCNLRCRHCFVRCMWERPPLDVNFLLRVATQARDAGCLFATLAGGEPLTHPDFSMVYQGLSDIGLRNVIATNATLVTKDIANLFADVPPFKLKVSLYAIEAATFSQVTSGNVPFDHFTRGLDLLRDKGIPFTLIAMMLATNKRAPEEVEEFADRWGVPVEFNAEITAGLSHDPTPLQYRLTPDDIKQYYVANARNYNRLYHVPRQPRGAKWDKDGLHRCNCGRTSFFVDSLGSLHPCSLSDREGIDLRETPFAEAWSEVQRRLGDWVGKTELHVNNPDLTMCPPFVRLQGAKFDLKYHLAVSKIQNEREQAFQTSTTSADGYRGRPRKDDTFDLNSFLAHISGFITKCACSADDKNPYQVS
ncbi:MAG: radical SAM protein [Sedimentisphaerales bacterium]|nr:radical SAM protein [Sedimentisphaerales bacterium]